jgi:acetyl esterase/lipase
MTETGPRGMTRREALELLGLGAAAAVTPAAAAAQAPAFPRGAVIRTLFTDYAPDELASGATLFHEHMSLGPDFNDHGGQLAAHPDVRAEASAQAIVTLARLAIVVSCLAAAVVPAAAQTYPVRVVRNVAYVQAAGYSADKDKLDLYLPVGRVNAPVIVSYYGNQLMGGDKDEEGYIGHRFASAGFATAVVNYRVSPAVSHPAHVQDAAASFAWVKRNIRRYGGDPSRVFAIGYSAGGYLAALLSTDPRYLAAHGLSPRDIRGTVAVSAFYRVEGQGVAPDRDKSVWGTDRNAWVEASPAHHLRGAVPPLLILYADGDEDWRRQQNVEMAAAMKAAGIGDVEIAMVPGRNHATIWSRVGVDGDETARHIIRFASR